MIKSCTGCHYRVVHWSGLFIHKMAGRVERMRVNDPMCEIHGDPEFRARYLTALKEDQCE